ncbi:hypothetical protein UB37_12035 [Photobacterium iliopiscarium]|uniref:Uncharacterized protein n=1 Tax=Photobacterium iliopiscarium TaxID=56192 RepID=A0ABX5GW14_9GAMM|nr:hypothetical protein [Photobacterium iliopiscarium]KJG21070.1 hypothetical protein UB37_12035 [Photobacterium iliopiscarium]PSW99248.1 hypothetical protein C9J52_02490 [Photobacterium iliopiscarium]
MSFIDVKNKNGTADKNPPAGYKSWLDFWESKKGKKATTCEVLTCSGEPDVGGHVIKSGEGSKVKEVRSISCQFVIHAIISQMTQFSKHGRTI